MNERPSLDSLKIDRGHHHGPHISRGLVFGIVLAIGLLAATGAAGLYFWDRATGGVRIHAASAAAVAGAGGGGDALDASGYVVARRQATLSSKIAGKLVEANLEEGERVQQGQVVARLDDSNYRAILNSAIASEKLAEVNLANAEPTYQRYQKLRAQNAVSEDLLMAQKTLADADRMNLAVAKAQLAVAQASENDTVVRAPFSGIVTAKVAQAGDFVAPTAGGGGGGALTGIATIVDMDSLEVDVDVSEDYIDRVSPDQKATVTLNAYPDWQIPAHVIAVIPTADQSKGTVKVRVAMEVKDKRILPQMGARVSFIAPAGSNEVPVSRAVTIPADAVQGVGENASVFLVKDDGTVAIQPVTTGAKKGDAIVIRAGLQPGDRVAIDNFDKLSDGAKVTVVE